MRITAKIFESRVGRKPVQDDLERCNCKEAGKILHSFCGWCNTHNLPVFSCGCCFPDPDEKKPISLKLRNNGGKSKRHTKNSKENIS